MILVPLTSLVIGFFMDKDKEQPIFWTQLTGLGISFFAAILLFGYYIANNFEPLFINGLTLYKAAHSDFSINFFLDGYTFTYLLITNLLVLLIAFFSKYYMHREKDYKRFFTNLIAFYIGLILIVSSGNIETLFIGWEVIGVTSFFLIGFYRERYLPVKNALKVVSIYRIADIALLLAIWVSHHYFSHSINFNNMHSIESTANHLLGDDFYQLFIPCLFLIAAIVKSAQFPFSSWLPRAMEGPTTSSAIFYGSLSVHIGVFLLIRTSPLWEGNVIFQGVVIAVGLITTLLANSTAKVQSSIKTQIAYSSIAQIGLMFVEVALGFHVLAMIHLVSHAFLRSYQLLVSPSVLSYRIHDQFFNFKKPIAQGSSRFVDKIKLTIYTLSIKEFNLDSWMYNWLWTPMKKIGKLFDFLSPKATMLIFLPTFILGLYGVYNQDLIGSGFLSYTPVFFASISLILILKAFVERDSSMWSWTLLLLSQLFITLFIGFNEQFDFNQIHMYLSGVFVCGLIGYLVIRRLSMRGVNTSLNKFHGHVYEYPTLAFVFALACLGLAGFPITPTFLGEDLMLGHIHENQFGLLILTALNLILDGLVVFRIYSRLFLGLHERGYHVIAYKSS